MTLEIKKGKKAGKKEKKNEIMVRTSEKCRLALQKMYIASQLKFFSLFHPLRDISDPGDKIKAKRNQRSESKKKKKKLEWFEKKNEKERKRK